MAYTPLQKTHGLGDPYRVLVISMMLNLTHRDQVRRLLKRGFFRRWPTATKMAKANHEELAGFMAPLGLARQRARRMVHLARALEDREAFTGRPLTASDVPSLPGCGLYAQEAYKIFVDGDFDFTPQDKVLAEYVRKENRGE